MLKATIVRIPDGRWLLKFDNTVSKETVYYYRQGADSPYRLRQYAEKLAKLPLTWSEHRKDDQRWWVTRQSLVTCAAGG